MPRLLSRHFQNFNLVYTTFMTIALHNLPSRVTTKRHKRVGRGNASGRGTYSTRGMKGQRSRSGGRKGLRRRSLMNQLIKKTPKIGGFRSLQAPNFTITLKNLEQKFIDGDKVNLATLQAKKLVKQGTIRVKIVATGQITKKIIIENLPTTPKAAELIAAAGGQIVTK